VGLQKWSISVLCLMLLVGCAALKTYDLYEGDNSQAATLLSFDTLLVDRIDQRDMGMGLIGQRYQYFLSPGNHVLVVRYADMWDENAGDHEKITSPAITVAFTLEAGKTYQLGHSAIKNIEASIEFAKRPALYLIDVDTGKTVDVSFDIAERKNILSALNLVADFSKQDHVRQPDNFHPLKNTFSDMEPKVNSSTPLSALKQAWQQANQQDRSEFLQWIVGDH